MNNRLGAYLEQEILSATGIQLVHLLYQAAMTQIRDARRNLAAGKVAERCANISKACDLVGELLSSLDREAGGEIAQRLQSLYNYILTRLLDANMRKSDAPLAEVLGLLCTLDEAWKELAQDRPAYLSSAGAFTNAGAFANDAMETPVHAWSL